MKIFYDLAKEKASESKLITEIKKSPNKNIFLEVYDKVSFIEKLSNSLKKGEKVKIKIDEKSSDYPNILNDELPRLIIQRDVEKEKILLSDYLKDFVDYDFKLEKKGNEFFLEITRKTDGVLDLKLKFDNDKTIDLNLLTDKKCKDKIFFGKKSYYYIKKEHN